MNPEVLIIGCGFLGEAAADLFSTRGKRVLGLVKNHDSMRAFEGKSFDSATCDITSPADVDSMTDRLKGVELAIYSVSSGGAGAEAYAVLYREGLRRVLTAWRPQRVLFVSSTSVYAQTDGDWVTEESPTQPERDTGKILLEAEEIALNFGGSVLRLSGIYGPGRSVLLRKFLSGEAVLENGGSRWINQIHRDDAAAAMLKLSETGISSGIYNVSDDRPATQKEIYEWMAGFLKRPLPHDGIDEMKRKRGWTSKKVSNRKLHGTGWVPRFPSYRDALPLLGFPN